MIGYVMTSYSPYLNGLLIVPELSILSILFLVYIVLVQKMAAKADPNKQGWEESVSLLYL